jgi:hypothetical protein
MPLIFSVNLPVGDVSILYLISTGYLLLCSSAVKWDTARNAALYASGACIALWLQRIGNGLPCQSYNLRGLQG